MAFARWLTDSPYYDPWLHEPERQMSDLISAISADIERYEELCLKYGEEPVKVPYPGLGTLSNPYGPHARKLIRWEKFGRPKELRR